MTKYVIKFLIWGNRCRYFFWALFVQLRLNGRIRRIRKLQRPIRVAFLTRSATSTWFERVFEMMRADSRFEPKYVMLPFIGHGEAAEENARTSTYQTLVANVGKEFVVPTWNGAAYDDVMGDFDLCLILSPYDNLTIKPYRIATISTRGIPVIYCRYFTDGGTRFTAEDHNRKKELFFLWRHYLDNERVVSDVARSQPLLRFFDRLRTVGIPKTDKPCEAVAHPRSRKRVILAPHHSVGKNNLFWIGNFPAYKDFYLSLPERYPQIDWVWRPHGLLYTRMDELGLWTPEEKAAFHQKITSFPNVEYQNGGAYYDTFVNSDGMIQDCESFLPEYTYTGKPQCYILRDQEEVGSEFTDYGRSLLAHTYQAFSPEQVISFVDNVILKGEDPMKEDRLKFRSEIMYNFPKASEAIYEDLCRELKG